jgi:hypothetical protein
MKPTAYVVDPDPEERKRIEAMLSPSVEAVRGLDDAEALLAVLVGVVCHFISDGESHGNSPGLQDRFPGLSH